MPATAQGRYSYKQFKLNLVIELIGDYNSRQQYGMPRPTYDLAKAKFTTPTKRRRSDNIDEENGHYPTKCNKFRCWYCWNVNKMRHETRLKCKACDVPLCVYTHNEDDCCFEKYHIDHNCIRQYFLSLKFHLQSLCYHSCGAYLFITHVYIPKTV